jgi:hypothetical protein
MGCLFTVWIYGFMCEPQAGLDYCSGRELYIPFAGFLAAVIVGGIAYWGAPRRWVVAGLGIAVLLGASLWLWYGDPTSNFGPLLPWRWTGNPPG